MTHSDAPARHTPPATPRDRAFTLIELLVVVSVIALLMSILLPAVGSARKTALATSCGTNINSLGKAMHTYMAGWNGKLPMNGLIFPKGGGKNTAPTTGFGYGEPNVQKWDVQYGVLWTEMKGEYGVNSPGLRKIFLCPEDNLARRKPEQLVRAPNGTISVIPPSGVPAAESQGYWSYSVNTVLNSEGRFRENFSPKGGTGKLAQPWADPVSLNDTNNVVRPSDFIVFVEEGPTSLYNDEVFDAPAYNGGDFLANRHNNGGNIGFGDTHVEWFSATLFNNVPGTQDPSNPNHGLAMSSPFTRMFFPDFGAFAPP